mmetsp:Transcript_125157/g.359441  ORF Transcript_125157/g.359441 Transcript_125157/m.359441 type:complete len:574 (+) Transcript_125157:115-1836(+)
MGQNTSRSVMCCALRDKDGMADGFGGDKDPYFSCAEAEVALPDDPMFIAYAPLHHQAGSPRRIAVASSAEVAVYLLPDVEFSGEAQVPVLTHRLRLDSGQQVHSILWCEEERAKTLAVAVGPANCSGLEPAEYAVQVWTCRDARDARSMSCGTPCGTPRDPPCPPPQPAPQAAPFQRPRSYGLPGGVVDWATEDPEILFRHKALVVKMVTNKWYLLCVDANGECVVWQKTGWRRTCGFEWRGSALLHPSGIADIIVDRHFAYSAGEKDSLVNVWSLPELTHVMCLNVDLREEVLLGLSQPGLTGCGSNGSIQSSFISTAVPDTPRQLLTPIQSSFISTAVPDTPRQLLTPRLQTPRQQVGALSPPSWQSTPIIMPETLHMRVSLIRRPISRWQGPVAAAPLRTPRGCMFVAGVLCQDCTAADAGSGVLMEWSLGDKPELKSAVIAHTSPIASLAYGPCDNGPIVTADSKGEFRVWESTFDQGLSLAQQIELPLYGGCFTLPSRDCAKRGGGGESVECDSDVAEAGGVAPEIEGMPIVAVEPLRALWVAAEGRLFQCQRSHDVAPLGASFISGA